MTTTEQGHSAGPVPNDEGKLPLTFEEMFKNQPWLRGYTPESMNARRLAQQTYANYLIAIEQQAAAQLAREQAAAAPTPEQTGQDMSALALRKMAEDEYRGNDDPPLPQN